MAITAERDTAIRERNMALEERKRAFAERDMAMLQRDAAIAERNAAMQERDVALTASLGFRETSMDPNDDDSTGNEQLTTKHIILYQQQQQQQQHQQQQQQQMHVVPEEAAVAYNYSNLNNPREAKAPSLVLVKRESRSSRDDSRDYDDDYASGTANKPPPKKGERQQQPKEGKQTKSTKLPSRLLAGKKRKANSSSTSNNSWKNIESDDEEEDDVRKQQQALVSWKDNNLGLNQISFDESSMPGPVCTCTGSPQPCYRWGSGGWQSACCTTTISMYPLPQVANKRYSRVGGRKMSGSAFTKLLNRLAAKGYDLSTPLDLKDNWAKHGTNRYSTLK